MTSRQLRWGLLAIYIIHLIILGLFVYDVIPQQYHRSGSPFWFHHGSDNIGYYAQAQSIVSGEFSVPNKYPLGFPLLITPMMLLLQVNEHDALVEPIAMFWSMLMFPLGQVVLAWLVYQITSRRMVALLSVGLWTAFPVFMYIVLAIVWNPEFAEVSSVHLTWAQMLSDGPATLFTLLCYAVFWQVRKHSYAMRWIILLGCLCGFLTLIRLTGVLTVGSVGLLMLSEKRFREVVLIVLFATIVFLPQLIYNAHFFGSPLTTGYSVLDDLPPNGLFSLGYLRDAIAQLGILFPVLLILMVGLLLWGLWILWQWNRIGATLIILWIAGYLGIYSVYYYSWVGGLLRFWMPMYPAFAIIMATLVWGVYRNFKDIA